MSRKLAGEHDDWLQVCTIMESHLQEKVMLRKQDDNDELNKRLSDIEAWSSGTGAAKAEGSAQLLQNRDDDLLFNQVRSWTSKYMQLVVFGAA